MQMPMIKCPSSWMAVTEKPMRILVRQTKTILLILHEPGSSRSYSIRSHCRTASTKGGCQSTTARIPRQTTALIPASVREPERGEACCGNGGWRSSIGVGCTRHSAVTAVAVWPLARRADPLARLVGAWYHYLMGLRSGHPFWLLKNGILASYPALRRDESCEVAVIGGRITGALVAYHLVSEGVDSVLLDKR